MRNYHDRYNLEPVSLNLCRNTIRGDGRDNPRENWYLKWMLSRAFEFRFDDEPDFLIYSCGGNREHLLNTSSIRIYITGENIPAKWDEADYALTHEREYSERHWRLPLWRQWYAHEYSQVEQDFEKVKQRVTRFCNFVYSNDRALERIEFYDKLHARKHVDAGGKVRNNIGGRVDDKQAFMESSKFTIAFENESHPGYSTEKLIQPLLAGSIPIYWGDTTISKDLNPNRFINVHDYDSFDAAIDHVMEVDADDKLWEAYVREPLLKDNKLPDELTDEAIMDFFHGIFSTKKHQVSSLKRMAQKSKYQLQHSALNQTSNRLRGKVSRLLGK